MLDTGYSGFFLVPKDVFVSLGMEGLQKGAGILVDRRRVELDGAFGTLEFPEQGVRVDGLVQTAPWASEVLLGVDGIRKLFIAIDSCAKAVAVEPC